MKITYSYNVDSSTYTLQFISEDDISLGISLLGMMSPGERLLAMEKGIASGFKEMNFIRQYFGGTIIGLETIAIPIVPTSVPFLCHTPKGSLQYELAKVKKEIELKDTKEDKAYYEKLIKTLKDKKFSFELPETFEEFKQISEEQAQSKQEQSSRFGLNY